MYQNEGYSGRKSFYTLYQEITSCKTHVININCYRQFKCVNTYLIRRASIRILIIGIQKIYKFM